MHASNVTTAAERRKRKTNTSCLGHATAPSLRLLVVIVWLYEW